MAGVFSAVGWRYKDPVTYYRLFQMVDNVRAHDHRLDGSQGKPTTGKAAAGRVTEARGATGVLWTSITFPAGRFSKAPIVNVTPTLAAHTAVVVTGIYVRNVTASGFDVGIDRATTANTTVDWVALERDS